MKTLLALLNILSLLPPLVAVAWARVLAWQAGVIPPTPVLVLMLLATWLIYMLDRWMDAARARGRPQTLRHSVQWRWRYVLAVPWIAAGVACAFLLPQVPRIMLEEGLAMLGGVVVYLMVVAMGLTRRRHPLVKETCLAIVFTVGSGLPGIGFGDALRPEFLCMATAFFGLAFFNLVQVTRWEILPGQRKPLRRRSLFLASVLVVVCCTTLWALGVAPWAPLTALLALLVVSAPQFERLEIDVRVALADLALLVPAVLLWR